ncbi:MAG TPA: ABC transporter permease [Thermoanaerobaculaceae bacterium]|nr:ABC transporter permease [Thermoanaerobaculaceae bacterium]HRS15836.1 ABC transporter permease [Thermoanaerobaculaceae bacterium]
MLTARLIVCLFRTAARIQRKRMVLTVSAIAWGTVAILLLLSFGEGLKRSMEKGQRGLGDRLVILWMGQTEKPFAGLPAARPIRLVPEDVGLVLGAVPEIGAAAGEMHNWNVQLVNGRTALNKRVVGVQPAYGELRANYPQPGGRYIDDLDMLHKRRVVFLGDNLARDLFGDADPVGRTLQLADSTFTVIGVMQKKRQMGMYGGPDADRATIPLSTFEALFGRRHLSNLVYQPVSEAAAPAARRRFLEVMGSKYRFDPSDTRVFGFWDTIENARVFSNMMIGIEIFLGIIGALTLVIGGVGVANIMFAAVQHRTREIGIQMALGARRVWITGGLVLESLTLTFAGGLVGIGAGSALVRALAAFQASNPNEAMEFLGQPTISVPIAVTTVLLLGGIGLLSGYFPARRAVTIQPAAALRYE